MRRSERLKQLNEKHPQSGEAVKDTDTQKCIQLEQESNAGDVSTRTDKPTTRKRHPPIRENAAKKRKTKSCTDTNDDIHKDTETTHGTSNDAASNSKAKIEIVKDEDIRKDAQTEQESFACAVSSSKVKTTRRKSHKHSYADKQSERNPGVVVEAEDNQTESQTEQEPSVFAVSTSKVEITTRKRSSHAYAGKKLNTSLGEELKHNDIHTASQTEQETGIGVPSTSTLTPTTRKRNENENADKKTARGSGMKSSGKSLMGKTASAMEGITKQDKPDEWDVFGKDIANDIRALPSHKRRKSKFAIQKLLFDMHEKQVTVELPHIEVHSRYKGLSQRLYEVLEVVGASDKMRQRWRRLSIYHETGRTVYLQPENDLYVFGSTYEGTTTIGMDPDLDLVQIYNDVEVVRNLSEAPSGDCLLLIQDFSTPPGYCKLQLVHNGVPMRKEDKGWQKNLPVSTTSGDRSKRLVYSYIGISKEQGYVTHGPAERKGKTDNVFALKCFSWPDCAEEWLKRKRNHNWPSSDLIEVCSTLGFLLVCVGHPNSKEKGLQCRLSFSHQERLLGERFNPVQFKCYIVLKYIKLEIQDININELFLSSYHLKTAMFYLIENTPSDLWTPENLVSCVIAALKMIIRWIENDNCPNYFISDENMFEGKTDDRTRKILCNEIQRVISNDFEHFIAQIQRDSLGQLMNSSPHSQIFQDKKTDGQNRSLYLLCLCVLVCLNVRNRIIIRHFNMNIEEYISNLTQLQRTVRDKISQEHDKEKQTAWSFCLPFIQVSLLSNIVALDIQENRSKEEIWKSLTCDSWRELNMKIDSSKLKQGALMYMLEFNQDSVDNLASFEHDSRFSFCHCIFLFVAPELKDLRKASISSDATPEEFLRDVVSPCVVFLPTESNVTPIAIRYEMIRSFGMPPESRDDVWDFWYDWGVVDGRFLRHFLLYLNYSKLGSRDLAVSAVDDMLNLLEEQVSHRETCFNLLGWAYKLNGQIDYAIYLFKLSLKKQPTNNSAYWHLCFLVRDLLGANP